MDNTSKHILKQISRHLTDIERTSMVADIQQRRGLGSSASVSSE